MHSLDTYRLYAEEKTFSFAVRVRVVMKDKVDIHALDKAVNRTIKRYPYFSVKAGLDEDGAYVLDHNDRPVKVITSSGSLPKLGSKEVNEHLVFVDCKGRNIFFNISHSLCGGKGFMPWVMTNVYEYVREKYGTEPYAPEINKWDSPLLPTETAEPTINTLTSEAPIYTYKSKKPVVMIGDYMNGMYNPFARHPNYRIFTINQKDLLPFIKSNDSSVASFFLITMAKALDKVLPEKHKVIGGEIAHNPRESLGIPDAHVDILSHVHIDYERNMLHESMEKLGTMTRGQIILQTDPSVSHSELRRKLKIYEELDKVKSVGEKRRFYAAHDPSSGKEAQHGTYIVNYTGNVDWGELADYVDSYVIIVEGHLLLEITSLADKIFVCFMQLINTDKYANAFIKVLDEMGIPCTVKGPYNKNQTKHILPRE
ncbi:MAG: hypothetical protein J6N70_03245 [Oribacterium sp.]|nr:hypothetical protein [Oribacterium sp.]